MACRPDTRPRIMELLHGIERPGMDAVIAYLENNDAFWNARCYGHHRYVGGVADHSLEVYDFMVSHMPHSIPDESIVIAALFHDLGKAVREPGIRGEHPQRSVQKLDRLGLQLTDDERTAIENHHKRSIDFLTSGLRRLLSLGDMDSTGRYKREHPNPQRH